MATLTIRLPDDKHSRLKSLAQHRHISINKLIEELSTQAIAEFDTEVRFRALAATGDVAKGIEILDKLDSHFSKK
ncbi:MAG: toxin-antitoxin system HicB family antitoxin [Gammaproteobacteria bacterium]|nr:toxin-antitoxin system HicB family antitoxin [Gammaproteobacteria bacterium]